MNKENIKSRMGFIQGRLSPMINGNIQAFPSKHWMEEYADANLNEFPYMEWTLDFKDIHKNPLMLDSGQTEIVQLGIENAVKVKTLTGDFFMQKPFFKETGKLRDELIQLLINVIGLSAKIGVKIVVIPLVDNSSLKTLSDEDEFIEGMNLIQAHLKENNMQIAFESDFKPKQLKQFIDKFDAEYFGINYDIGNSASMGFNWENELLEYGNSVINVHIKDRVLGGTTVPLGEGDADIHGVIKKMESLNYQGLYILQTARAQDNNDVNALNMYRDYVLNRLD